MTNHTTVDECPDGTDFPLHWSEPADETFAWTLEPEHFPVLTPPLEVHTPYSMRCSISGSRARAATAVGAEF